jgi:uncharacterized protein
MKWFKLSAEQGNASAQFNLGVMYDNGRGTIQNYVKGYAWYSVSSASGSKIGTKNRDLLAKEMTPEQLAEGQKLASEIWARTQE